MLKKLQTLFPSAITVHVPPDTENEAYYWFKDEDDTNFWLGIPKIAITPEQLNIIKTLFHIVESESPSRLGQSARMWKNFLYGKNGTPILSENGVRIIQYHIKSSGGIQRELEEALMEFFHDAAAFIWIDQRYGIIIQENTETGYQEEDFHSIAATLENDFFIKTSFYVGKVRQDPNLIQSSFQLERHLFFEAQALLFMEKVFTFEKVFPALLASQLPKEAGTLLEEDMVRIFREDHELLETMKVFLEHNSNVSLSAKKLYIHRNTLQYRLEKFTEKTGISLKDFNSALTVYFACLMAESPE
jgi:sugar diacid utilization regulator